MATVGMFSLPPIPAPAGRALRPLASLCLVALGAAVAVHWLVLVPAADQLRRTQAAYEEARRHAVVLKQNRVTQEHVRALEHRLGQVWATLPTEQEFAALAIEISRSAETVGVSLPGMTHAHKQSKDGLPHEASLLFQATGKYQNIYRFIHELETMNAYLAIEQLEATRATETKARRQGAVQFNVRIVTFLRTDQEGAEPT